MAPALLGSVVDEACFCSGGCCHNGQDTDTGPGSADDDNGHGTRAAGAVASRGLVAAPGHAPAVELVPVKVLAAKDTFWWLTGRFDEPVAQKISQWPAFEKPAGEGFRILIVEVQPNRDV